MMRGQEVIPPLALRLLVAAAHDVAPGIRAFALVDPDGKALPPFEAGAHIDVAVTLPDGGESTRTYSLAGDPGDRTRYRIAVLRENQGRGGSRYLHDRVTVGDVLSASAPASGFGLPADAVHVRLIAGGIGITPILAMVHALAREGRSFDLAYLARTPEHHAFRDELGAVAGTRAHFITTRGPAAMRVPVRELIGTPRAQYHLYACGPTGLLQAIQEHAHELGWSRAQVHLEGFGVRADARSAPFDIHLARSGTTVHVDAETTALDALLAAGAWVSYDCRRGVCGSCTTSVLAGTPDHHDVCLPLSARENHFCPCVSRTRGTDLTLDL